MAHNLSVEESRRVLGLAERTDAVEVLEHDGAGSEKLSGRSN